jgi:DC-STAMP-like protein.
VRTNPRGLTPLSLNVDGEGVVADILKSVIASFKFVGAVMDIDTLPCLPDPVPPDVPRYDSHRTLFLLMYPGMTARVVFDHVTFNSVKHG